MIKYINIYRLAFNFTTPLSSDPLVFPFYARQTKLATIADTQIQFMA